jgi:hypothetical protein
MSRRRPVAVFSICIVSPGAAEPKIEPVALLCANAPPVLPAAMGLRAAWTTLLK